MNFVVQFPRIEGAEEFALAAEQQGHTVYRVPYVPFDPHLVDVLDSIANQMGGDYDKLDAEYEIRNSFVFGSIGFLGALLRKNWPQNWYDPTSLTCRAYLSRWGVYSVQEMRSPYFFLTIEEIRRMWNRIFRLDPSGDGCCYCHFLFFRPDDNLKSFSGRVYSKHESQTFNLDTDNCEIDDLVLVSEPQVISQEYRLFIIDGEIVTGSKYKQEGQKDVSGYVPTEVLQFAKEILLGNWRPSRGFVMDIGLVEGQPRLIEIGAINVAGLYQADVSRLVAAIAEALKG